METEKHELFPPFSQWKGLTMFEGQGEGDSQEAGQEFKESSKGIVKT